MDERAIIVAIKQGDKVELEKVYKMHRTVFIKWICSKFRVTDDEGNDLYHQSILIFYENILAGKLTELKSSIRTYLMAVGKNKVYEMLRYQHRQSANPSEHLPDQTIEDETDQTDEMITLSRKALRLLGDPCKTLLELYYYHKQSMQEIARQLGYKNENTTKNQKYKCLLRLRELFQKQIQKEKTLLNEAY